MEGLEKMFVEEILSGELSADNNMAHLICKSIPVLKYGRETYSPESLTELDISHKQFMAQRLFWCAHKIASASRGFIGDKSFENFVREIIVGI